jgi:predicted nucleotidyltransferase
MHFPTLMDECDPPSQLAKIVADLIASKAVTRELGAATVPAEVDDFIEQEFALARTTTPKPTDDEGARTAGKALFAELTRQFSPSA